MQDQRKATSDIRVIDEMGHFQELPPGHTEAHFQDHLAMLVFGKAGGNDVAVMCGMYHVGGKTWGIADAMLQQTQVIISPSEQRTMQNNEFVGNRFDPMKNFSDYQIVQQGDAAIWKAGNRQFKFSPPYWELTGEHMGVDVDLKIGGIGKSIPYHGPWSNLAVHAAAGNEHLGWAEGSFTYKGEKYTLDEGWAVRERTCFGKGRDVITLLGSTHGYTWGWCFSEAIKVFCFAQPESNTYSGRVFAGDQMIDFGKGEITVEPLESWRDPLIGGTYPIRWKIGMNSAKGTLEMDVRTWARSLCGFHLATGYTTHHCATGRTTGRFVFPDGKVVPIDESLSYFEQGKATPLSTG